MSEIVTIESVVAGTVLAEQLQVVSLNTPEVITVIAGGDQGPPGIPGPAGGTALQVLAATAIGGHRAVVLDATGRAIYADNSQLSHMHKVLGMTLNAGVMDDPINVVRYAEITEPSWEWVLDTPVFVGANGVLTQTVPAFPAAFSQIVGFPVSATTLFVTMREPIRLI